VWGGIIVLVILLIIVLFFLATYIGYNKAFHVRGRGATEFYEYFLSLRPGLKAMPFSCRCGKETIAGIRLSYVDNPKGLVVMVHGYGWNMEHYFPQAEYLAKAGYCIVLFDGVGIGRSTGRSIRGLPQHMLATSAVLDYVQSEPELSSLPLALYGHSWGGYAANAVSCYKPYPIKAIISVSAYNKPLGALSVTIRNRYGGLWRVIMLPLALCQYAGYGRVAGYSSMRGLAAANCNALVMHSKGDTVLPFDDNFRIIRNALADRPDIEFRAVDGRNHNLGIPEDVNERRRQIQRQIRQAKDSQELLRQLWDMQMIIDEKVLEDFVGFYDRSLRATYTQNGTVR